MELKLCKECKEVKPVSEFYKTGKYFYSYCKSCHCARNKSYKKISEKKKARIELIARYGAEVAEAVELLDKNERRQRQSFY